MLEFLESFSIDTYRWMTFGGAVTSLIIDIGFGILAMASHKGFRDMLRHGAPKPAQFGPHGPHPEEEDKDHPMRMHEAFMFT